MKIRRIKRGRREEEGRREGEGVIINKEKNYIFLKIQLRNICGNATCNKHGYVYWKN